MTVASEDERTMMTRTAKSTGPRRWPCVAGWSCSSKPGEGRETQSPPPHICRESHSTDAMGDGIHGYRIKDKQNVLVIECCLYVMSTDVYLSEYVVESYI